MFTENLFRLRGITVPSSDPSKSHIMKIRFPRKHLQKIVKQANLGKTTQFASPVVPTLAVPKHPDYIEIDDVLRISDPSEFTFDQHNRLDDADIKRIKKLAPNTESEAVTDATPASESQTERIEQVGTAQKSETTEIDAGGSPTEVSLGATNGNSDNSASTEAAVSEESNATEVSLGATLENEQSPESSQPSDSSAIDVSSGSTEIVPSADVPKDENKVEAATDGNNAQATDGDTKPAENSNESTSSDTAVNIEKSDVSTENAIEATQATPEPVTQDQPMETGNQNQIDITTITSDMTRSAEKDESTDKLSEKESKSDSSTLAAPINGDVQDNQQEPAHVQSNANDDKASLEPFIGSVQVNQETPVEPRSDEGDNNVKTMVSAPVDSVAGEVQTTEQNMEKERSNTEPTVGDAQEMPTESVDTVLAENVAAEPTRGDMLNQRNELEAIENSDATEPMIGSVQDVQAEEKSTESTVTVKNYEVPSPSPVADIMVGDAQISQSPQQTDSPLSEPKETPQNPDESAKSVENVESAPTTEVVTEIQDTQTQPTTTSTLSLPNTETATNVMEQATETNQSNKNSDGKNESVGIEMIEIATKVDAREAEEITAKASDNNEDNGIPTVEPIIGDAQHTVESKKLNENGDSNREEIVGDVQDSEAVSKSTEIIDSVTKASSQSAEPLTEQNGKNDEGSTTSTISEDPSIPDDQTAVNLGIAMKSTEANTVLVEVTPTKSTEVKEKTNKTPQEAVTSSTIPIKVSSETPKTDKAQHPTEKAANKTDPAIDGLHPLIKRIMLGVPNPANNPKPFQKFFEHIQSRSPLLASLFQLRPFGQQPQPTATAAPTDPKTPPPSQRLKKNVKRGIDDNGLIITPKPFAPLDLFPSNTAPDPAPRLSLIERYHAMSSGEKAEQLSKVLERVMHGLTIAGHVDGYLTHRVKTGFKKAHKIFQSSEEPQA